jgi:ribosome biogenesis protein ENP2
LRAGGFHGHRRPGCTAEATAVATGKDKNTGGKSVENPLGDTRFAALFKNPDFQIDMTSTEYRLRHPASLPSQGASDLLQEKFALVDEAGLSEAEEDEVEGRADDAESDEDVLELVAGRRLHDRRAEESEEANDEEGPQTARGHPERPPERKRAKASAKAGPRLYELRDGEELKPMTGLGQGELSARQKKRSFESLVKEAASREAATRVSRKGAGGKVITFQVGGRWGKGGGGEGGRGTRWQCSALEERLFADAPGEGELNSRVRAKGRAAGR